MVDDVELNKTINRIYSTINSIVQQLLEKFKDQPINDKVLCNMRSVLRNALKPLLIGDVANIDVDIYAIGNQVHIKPLNLFTGLAMAGYYVPAVMLEGKNEWTTDKFTMRVTPEGINIYPIQETKIEVTVSIPEEVTK
jgi:hypothetical protein